MSSGQTPSVTLQQRQAAAEAGIPFFDNSAVYESRPRAGDRQRRRGPGASDAAARAGELRRLPERDAARRVGDRRDRRKRAQHLRQRPRHPDHRAAADQLPGGARPGVPRHVHQRRLAATVDEIGTTIPEKVVSTLQENPDTNYIVFTSGDFSLGVAAAVQAAGFDDVRLIGATPIQANVESMRVGRAGRSMGRRVEHHHRLAARRRRGALLQRRPDPVAGRPHPRTTPARRRGRCTRIYTPETAPESADFVEPENYVEIFSELWQLP